MLLLAATSALAVPLEPGKLYNGETRIEVPDLGLAITLPEGWQGLLPPDASVFVMESRATQANLFLMGDRLTLEELRQVMSSRIPLDDGVVLVPSGQVREAEGWLEADYDVRGEPTLKSRIRAQTGTSGVAFAIIAISDDARFDDALAGIDAVSSSVVFSEPVQPPSPPGLAGDWQDYLKGRYVVRLYTGSGYYEEEHIWLCSDGSFFRRSSSGGSSLGSGASAAFGGRGQGVWRAEGALAGPGQLVLRYGATSFEGNASFGRWEEQGGPTELNYDLLLSTDDKLYLNDRRWFRDANQRCQ